MLWDYAPAGQDLLMGGEVFPDRVDPPAAAAAAVGDPCETRMEGHPAGMHAHGAAMWMSPSPTRIGRRYWKALYRCG